MIYSKAEALHPDIHRLYWSCSLLAICTEQGEHIRIGLDSYQGYAPPTMDLGREESIAGGLSREPFDEMTDDPEIGKGLRSHA